MARIKIIGELDLKREQDRRVYDNTGLAPCLRAENHDVKIFDVKTKFLGRYGYDKTRQDKTRQDNDSAQNESCQVVVLGKMDNTIDHTFESANRVYSRFGVCPTIPTGAGGGHTPKLEVEVMNEYRIRKLTPKECWRLMGYTDEDYEKAEKVNSNTQLYKQAGNAIVKQVLMAIFSQLFIQNITAWNEREETIKHGL